jgi:hypothetical protein
MRDESIFEILNYAFIRAVSHFAVREPLHGKQDPFIRPSVALWSRCGPLQWKQTIFKMAFY